MRKLKLSIDDLEVTTFQTAARDGKTGTVMAHIPPSGRPTCAEGYWTCDAEIDSCNGAYTCGAGTCPSCGETCWPFC